MAMTTADFSAKMDRQTAARSLLQYYEKYVIVEYRLCLWVVQLRWRVKDVEAALKKNSQTITDAVSSTESDLTAQRFEVEVIHAPSHRQQESRNYFLNSKVSFEKDKVLLTPFDLMKHQLSTFEEAIAKKLGCGTSELAWILNLAKDKDMEDYLSERHRDLRGMSSVKEENLEAIRQYRTHWKETSIALRDTMQEFRAGYDKEVKTHVTEILARKEWNQEGRQTDAQEKWSATWSKVVSMDADSDTLFTHIEDLFMMTFILCTDREHALLQKIKDVEFDDEGILCEAIWYDSDVDADD